MLALATASAGAATFKTSVKGSQELSWSLDGTTSGCEVRRGQGSGVVKFSFKSPKSANLFVSSARKAPNIVGSLGTKAVGSISGSFSDTLSAACGGFEPGPPVVHDASGCGATAFNLRMDFKTRGKFVHVTGPSLPGGPVSTAANGTPCPFPIDDSLLFSTDLAACGDGTAIWDRSFGVATSGGRGLLLTKLAISSKSLLKTKKRHSKVITGRAVVDCSVPSFPYTSPVKMKAELKFTLTMKRSS